MVLEAESLPQLPPPPPLAWFLFVCSSLKLGNFLRNILLHFCNRKNALPLGYWASDYGKNFFNLKMFYAEIKKILLGRSFFF
jgi:hypothetical protein